MQAVRISVLTMLFVLLAYCALWGSLALWFRLPLPTNIRLVASILFGGLGAFTLWRFFSSSRWRALCVFAFLLGGVGLWWSTIAPPTDGNWAADVAHQSQGTIKGDILTISNMRDFTWRSSDDYDARWITRSFDLSKLESTDLIMSHWSNPLMAHMIISFGFEGGEHLAWSVEVRRKIGDEFSPVADFFKEHTLVYIAATEADIIGTRSNIRGEDVYLYRLNTRPDGARQLLELYLADANKLAQTPQWYNSIFKNCTTDVLNLVQAMGIRVPLDYRLLANGYLPDFLYDQGWLAGNLPLEEIKLRSYVSTRAKIYGLRDGFSKAIREGIALPKPLHDVNPDQQTRLQIVQHPAAKHRP